MASLGPDRDNGVRGRLVVLVDNAVITDSRVQKIALSATEAGWDVIVVGRSSDDSQHSWNLGPVPVRLVPVASRRGGNVSAVVRRLAGPSASRRTGLRRAARRAYRFLRLPWDKAVVAYWLAVLGDRSWRKIEPHLLAYEAAYGPLVDDLRPDLIHANDFRMLGVAARAVERARSAGRQVKLVWDAHEFLPGTKPWVDDPKWLPGNCAHEREYAPRADAVITVSEDLADLLQRHHRLPVRPTVVLNAPIVGKSLGPTLALNADDQVPSLREQCGVGPNIPIMVYAGVAAKQRGLDIMIKALPRLPRVHAVFVVPDPGHTYVIELQDLAARQGVAERIHILPYVPAWQVVSFLSEADVGIIPIHHWPNHEIALITKFFEYSHARLPVVVSDVRTMAQTVRRTGQGEVFRAGDVDDFIRAVQAVLTDPDVYRSAYDAPDLLENWTWATQARILDRVYSQLIEGASRVG